MYIIVSERERNTERERLQLLAFPEYNYKSGHSLEAYLHQKCRETAMVLISTTLSKLGACKNTLKKSLYICSLYENRGSTG